jgi:hypothetical protein
VSIGKNDPTQGLYFHNEELKQASYLGRQLKTGVYDAKPRAGVVVLSPGLERPAKRFIAAVNELQRLQTTGRLPFDPLEVFPDEGRPLKAYCKSAMYASQIHDIKIRHALASKFVAARDLWASQKPERLFRLDLNRKLARGPYWKRDLSLLVVSGEIDVAGGHPAIILVLTDDSRLRFL